MFRTKLKKSAALVVFASSVLLGCSQHESQQEAQQNTTAEPLVSKTLLQAPVQLKVGEGFIEPLGYYESKPRFSWRLMQGLNSFKQTAYQIQVASDAQFKSPIIWDSGQVESSANSWIKYQGQPLQSRQTVFWRVKVWNEAKQASKWSSAQSLEMGLLANKDWTAKWIGHTDTELAKSPSQALIATPQYLRTEFALDKSVKTARLYISAKGLFKAYINGQQVAPQDVMTPGWTPYQKRIETLTYDVTDLLAQGQNALAATLAGGWYSGRIFDLKDQDHTQPPRLIAQLEVTYQDGSIKTIATDETWLASQQGPIRFASIYDGEKYDQAKEIPGWNAVNKNISLQSSKWTQVTTENLDADVALSPKRHAPIRVIESLPVQQIVKADTNSVVFDFGQNMVGVPKVSIPMLAGQTAKIRFAEALHKGEFYTDNYRSAHSTNYFTADKTGVIHYQPSFTYHGYRYVEISGFDPKQTPSKDWVTAIVQHSDMALANNFTSSHSKLNQLLSNVVWGLRSNFYDIPLDCPQRDERMGWTGDAQVFVTPSMYMADSYAFWSAWLQSLREDQTAEGKIPSYVPYKEWKVKWASSGWGDAATIIPWDLYMMTGDKQVLADNYAMMQAWVRYHTSHSKNAISSMMTFGDWLQPFTESKQVNRGDTPFDLISTAYYARSIELTLKTAKELGKTADVAELQALHQQVKQAFRQHFFDSQLNPTQGLATQTTYLLGLAFNLFDGEEIEIAQQILIMLLKEADNHLRTGFLGTPLLASVLQDAGRSDLVYELIFKETYPSWFYSVNNGATTTWERWNSYSLKDGFNPQGMNSLNHYAYGSISRWFYEGMLGIQPKTPGFKQITIAPQLGEQLNQAQGFYDTPQGRVEVAWQVTDKQFNLKLVVPSNTTAEIILPKQLIASTVKLNGSVALNQALQNLSAGSYNLTATLAD
ncbi:rhamnosidase [Saccharobesus litoralis]|uniref:alpha-L-rhamnosidase n=1 Tax=Saccharobesus litoralis TaxID=2172099 RepID=A0A2S0VN09_9ALTE|nr:family 78 glycoside hydrolase catalytic domain [Saccharobesus litoralis]AWB65559.1 rhamnosidase [Saccharobesus litoralis]